MRITHSILSRCVVNCYLQTCFGQSWRYHDHDDNDDHDHDHDDIHFHNPMHYIRVQNSLDESQWSLGLEINESDSSIVGL